MKNNYTLIIQSDHWQSETVLSHLIEKVMSLIISHHTDLNDRSVAFVFSDDDQVQQLNHQFRGKDNPTNVLSFPSDQADEWGDVILAHETTEKEATEQNKTFEHHLIHLIIHGVLHLLGYDHIDDKDAAKMESFESELLEALDIANPYETM